MATQPAWHKQSRLISDFGSLIEDMDRDELLVWGFVVYRCCYDSDEDWDRAMEMLRMQTNKDLHDTFGWAPLESSLVYTKVEDKSAVDGASIDQVWQKFEAWMQTEPWETEQAGWKSAWPRYEICVMIDRDSLHSILHKRASCAMDRFSDLPECSYVIAIADSAEWESEGSG